MKIGDLVKNLNSESKMTGIVVGWHQAGSPRDFERNPVVQWADGRCNWITLDRVELVHENR